MTEQQQGHEDEPRPLVTVQEQHTTDALRATSDGAIGITTTEHMTGAPSSVNDTAHKSAAAVVRFARATGGTAEKIYSTTREIARPYVKPITATGLAAGGILLARSRRQEEMQSRSLVGKMKRGASIDKIKQLVS